MRAPIWLPFFFQKQNHQSHQPPILIPLFFHSKQKKRHHSNHTLILDKQSSQDSYSTHTTLLNTSPTSALHAAELYMNCKFENEGTE